MVVLTSSENSIGKRLNELGFNSYKEYLLSNHWIEFRKKFFKKDGRVRLMRKRRDYLWCQFCNKQGVLHLHHKTYKRLGCEILKDVVFICADCHKEIHSMERTGRKNLFVRTKMIGRKHRKKLGIKEPVYRLHK